MKEDLLEDPPDLLRKKDTHRVLLYRPVPYRLFGTWDSLFPLKTIERSYVSFHANNNEYDDIFYLGYIPGTFVSIIESISPLEYEPVDDHDEVNPQYVRSTDTDNILHEYFDLTYGGILLSIFLWHWTFILGIYGFSFICTSTVIFYSNIIGFDEDPDDIEFEDWMGSWLFDSANDLYALHEDTIQDMDWLGEEFDDIDDAVYRDDDEEWEDDIEFDIDEFEDEEESILYTYTEYHHFLYYSLDNNLPDPKLKLLENNIRFVLTIYRLQLYKYFTI